MEGLTIKQKIAALPDSPGVYLMKQGGNIIYVGKALNLKNRVRSYFQSPKNLATKVRALMEKVDDFDIVLVDSEFEALILECNLIKKYRPWYNILLKDDKHYPYLRVDMSEDYPRVELVRTKKKDGAKYFGPYPGATVVREVLDVLRLAFPIRDCKRKITDERTYRPCLQYDIGQCMAPCAHLCTKEEYAEAMRKVLEFLQGHPEDILRECTEKMEEAAKNMQFERAAIYRDRIQSIQRVMQSQKAILLGEDDRDIIALAGDGMDMLVKTLFIRGGKLIGADQHEMIGAGGESDEDVLASFILQYYAEAQIPKEILVETMPTDAESLEQWLQARAERAVHLHQPQRGEKRKELQMAKKNAEDAFAKMILSSGRERARTRGAAEDLGKSLGLDGPAYRIEAYDISNTQGVYSVASMVVFEDGKPKKSDYRKFRIKTVVGANDFASHQEVLTRRLERYKTETSGSFAATPSVILIDGGKGQLSAALAAMEETGVHFPVFGLAEQNEEVFLPGKSDPLILPRGSAQLHLIQRVRDEAHRFAITFHRNLRAKNSIKSQLLDVPGLGEKRLRALYKHFQTLQAMKDASYEELAACPGMNKTVARSVYDMFHGEQEAEAVD